MIKVIVNISQKIIKLVFSSLENNLNGIWLEWSTVRLKCYKVMISYIIRF